MTRREVRKIPPMGRLHAIKKEDNPCCAWRTSREGNTDKKARVEACEDGIPGSDFAEDGGLDALMRNFSVRQTIAVITPPIMHHAVVSSLFPSNIPNTRALTNHFVDSLMYQSNIIRFRSPVPPLV